HESSASTAKSAIGVNIQLITNNGEIPTALSRDTETANEKVARYDLAKFQEKQEIANLTRQIGATSVGDLAKQMGWEDGSPQKVALHGLVGFLSAQMSGGNGAAGVASGMTTEWLNTKVEEYLTQYEQNQTLTTDERKAIQQASAALIGAATGAIVGGDRETMAQGATTALSAERYNRQLHPDELKWIKAHAKEFAAQEGLTVEEAEKRLITQAAQQVDYAWFKLINTDDRAASLFLSNATSGISNLGVPLFNDSETHFINSDGVKQKLFTANKAEYYSAGKYSDWAAKYDLANNQILSKTLQSNIRNDLYISSIKSGVQTAVYAFDHPDMVVKGLTLGISESLKAPVDSISNWGASIGNSIWESGKDIIGYDYNIQNVNYLYGQDMTNKIDAIALVRGGSAVAEVVPTMKTASVGVKGVINSVGNQVARVQNYSVLKQVLSGVDNIAVSTNKGFINSSKVCEFGCEIKPTSNFEKSLIDEIVKYGDTNGKLTEALFNELSPRSGYKVLDGGKYNNGKNGFDHVLVGSDGTVVIVDSKQINKGAVQVNTKGAGDNIQLSSDWIRYIADTKLSRNDPVRTAILTGLDNNSLKTVIVGVDKADSKLKLIPVSIPNKK
ncbi:MAG: VENN motif pre-toxin domain-containing protein, partial [[Pasteurella] mairii]|nr:VENN motif pre-toxin domain-containing protein [[Pasteurella] mairii]